MAERNPLERPIRVAMIGQKGYPPVQGGIERHVAELAVRLVADGFTVDLYSRPHYSGADGETIVEGLRIRRLPSIPTKHLDALTHSVLATVDAVRRGYDIVHYHALGPGLFAGWPRWLGRARTVTTVHGLDWQREKWGWFASRVLKIGETASARLPDRTIVVSKALQEHYRKAHGCETVCIPNGIARSGDVSNSAVRTPGVRENYILFVGRLVPEKGCHNLIRAYASLSDRLRARHQLVVAGGAGFTNRYERDLKRQAGAGVLFTGFVHGAELTGLWHNAALVVLPSTVEGLSIALLEGMSFGKCCLASDIPPNREAGGDAVAFTPPNDPESLAKAIVALLSDPRRRQELGERARRRVDGRYSWDQAAAATAAVYRDLVPI